MCRIPVKYVTWTITRNFSRKFKWTVMVFTTVELCQRLIKKEALAPNPLCSLNTSFFHFFIYIDQLRYKRVSNRSARKVRGRRVQNNTDGIRMKKDKEFLRERMQEHPIPPKCLQKSLRSIEGYYTTELNHRNIPPPRKQKSNSVSTFPKQQGVSMTRRKYWKILVPYRTSPHRTW